MTKKIAIKEEDYLKLEAEANKQNQTVNKYIEDLARKL